MASIQLLVVLPLASLFGLVVAGLPYDEGNGKGWTLSEQPRYPQDDNSKQSTDLVASIGASSVFKKLPNEDKSLKKLRKSGVPAYCHEIASKGSRDRCYKCKDPSSGFNYEQCLDAPSNPIVRRTRSSNVDLQTVPSFVSQQQHKLQQPQRQSGYRFSDDYFRSSEVELEPSASDSCKRVRRNSMLCMVCNDPQTNAKYEQCSYVGKPNRKAMAFATKSQEERAKPRQKSDKPRERSRERYEEHPEISSEEESKEASRRHDHSAYPEGSSSSAYTSAEDEEPESSRRSEKIKSDDKGCRSVEKDGETCVVCTNPKNGAKSERCNYSYEPRDKAYAYTKSKSFGYPKHKSYGGEDGEDREKAEAEAETEAEAEAEAEGGEEEEEKAESAKLQSETSAEDYDGSYVSPDYIRSESERISKKVTNEHCREEKRDSMICQICKDPQTGDDFEQCNYSYDPDDKVYAYSKSKHFGSPSSSGNEGSAEESSSVLDYLPKPSESQRNSVVYAANRQEKPNAGSSRVDTGFHDASLRRAEIEKIVKDIDAQDRSNCSKTYRDGMTCYSCKDDRKGFTDEECVFVTEPDLANSYVHVTSKPATTTSSTLNKLRKSREIKEDATVTEEMPQPLQIDEDLQEAEPYDYVAETRPIYDKVLGLTLPAYMVKRSPLELDFDESVENSKF